MDSLLPPLALYATNYGFITYLRAHCRCSCRLQQPYGYAPCSNLQNRMAAATTLYPSCARRVRDKRGGGRRVRSGITQDKTRRANCKDPATGSMPSYLDLALASCAPRPAPLTTAQAEARCLAPLEMALRAAAVSLACACASTCAGYRGRRHLASSPPPARCSA